MDEHLASLTQTNLQVQSATLIESTCFKVCGDPNAIPTSIQELYCGFGCCKKSYVVSNGQAIFQSAQELSPCSNYSVGCPGNTTPFSDCIMNCN